MNNKRLKNIVFLGLFIIVVTSCVVFGDFNADKYKLPSHLRTQDVTMEDIEKRVGLSRPIEIKETTLLNPYYGFIYKENNIIIEYAALNIHDLENSNPLHNIRNMNYPTEYFYFIGLYRIYEYDKEFEQIKSYHQTFYKQDYKYSDYLINVQKNRYITLDVIEKKMKLKKAYQVHQPALYSPYWIFVYKNKEMSVALLAITNSDIELGKESDDSDKYYYIGFFKIDMN